MQYSPEHDAAMAEALEVLAEAIRAGEKLLALAKKRDTTVSDLDEAAPGFIDKVYELELLLAAESWNENDNSEDDILAEEAGI